jgi:Uma2 family endonuclease
VVQPDVSFVSAGRAQICTDRIWGAPDLAAEVLSFGNSQHDRTEKVDWYRRYGVEECWLVDPIRRQAEVIDLARMASKTFGPGQIVRSRTLQRLRLRMGALLAG